MDTIFYRLGDGLYVNLTNRCPCRCSFCLRQTRNEMGGSGSLWLEHEPGLAEVLAALQRQDFESARELVFCGFGEPTEALEVLKGTARAVRELSPGLPIRLNTNGLGNLVNGRPIAGELAGLVDTVSISLNTPDSARYEEVARPRFGKAAFPALVRFAKDCAAVLPEVVLTTVRTTISPEEEAQCAALAREIGARYRIRELE